MLRTPLGQISGNRRCNEEYTPYQRGLLHEATAAGATSCQLQKLLHMSESSIRYTLSKHLQHYEGHSIAHSGRPKLLSDRSKRLLIRMARQNPKATYQNLIKQAGLTCSHDTVYHLLKEEGITN